MSIEMLRVVVDYSRSVEEVFEAGEYDWANCKLSSKDLVLDREGSREVEVRLVPFRAPVENERVRQEFTESILRPVDLPTILALGEQHPQAQLDSPIVALDILLVGALDEISPYAVGLWGPAGERRLFLYELEPREDKPWGRLRASRAKRKGMPAPFYRFAAEPA